MRKWLSLNKTAEEVPHRPHRPTRPHKHRNSKKCVLMNTHIPARTRTEAPEFSYSDDEGSGDDHVARSFHRTSERLSTCFSSAQDLEAYQSMKLIDQLNHRPTRSRKQTQLTNISEVNTKDYSKTDKEEVVVLDAYHVLPFKKRKLAPPAPPAPPSPPSPPSPPAPHAHLPVAYASWRVLGPAKTVPTHSEYAASWRALGLTEIVRRPPSPHR